MARTIWKVRFNTPDGLAEAEFRGDLIDLLAEHANAEIVVIQRAGVEPEPGTVTDKARGSDSIAVAKNSA